MTNVNNTQRLNRWLHLAEIKYRSKSEKLPLRRDVVTVLTYVRDHKVIGTQSTGNFPLKVVREVTAQFVNPPVLDPKIGDRVHRLQSEDDIWPLVFVHTLLYDGDLLELGPGRRWQVTGFGNYFLETRPAHQIWGLLAVWWEISDWIMAYPYVGMGDGLPPGFRRTTLEYLRSLLTNTSISLESFADKLIQATGLTWTSADTSFHRSALHGAVRRMVIHILSQFEMVIPDYQEEPLGKGTVKKLVAFQITPFGHDLLDSLPV